jgi:chitin synthase
LKLAEQIKALESVLDSFGNAKTLMNPNASRHGRYLELHFNERGRISAAKVLTFGLDTRLNRLMYEEHTYHVFYQFLAGTTPAEQGWYHQQLGISQTQTVQIISKCAIRFRRAAE